MNNNTFGSHEAICLMITMISTKAILSFPNTMAKIGGSAAWIVAIYISILAIIVFYITSKLYSNFEGKDIIDIGEILGGKALKIPLGILIIVFLVALSAFYLRSFSEEMKTMSFTMSPIGFIMLFFVLGMIISAYIGFEALIRFQSIMVPISVISFTLFIIALAPSMNIDNVKPILGLGPYNIFVKGAVRIGDFAELIFLFLLPPFIKKWDIFNRVGFIGLAICAIVLTSITFTFVSIFPYPVSTDDLLPTYELARIIKFGRFFERAESILVITWATIAFMYLSTAFYFLLHIFKKTFDLCYYQPLILPMALVIMSLSLLPKRLMDSILLEAEVFRNYIWIIAFAIPLLLLIVARALNNKKSSNSP
ncbi:endospore germination permease [Acetivibrio thermocellus]|uniref:GerAB/ArcD/ProY family transporter n=1 Tax=Acetivibrio thermocellus TaxID=1515 RepID=UPI0010A624F4|nr:endospore germination permease [Acetivibrio thermocellus]THJ78216.1 spore gernimation protein [Acetivibrio thermocellus]